MQKKVKRGYDASSQSIRFFYERGSVCYKVGGLKGKPIEIIYNVNIGIDTVLVTEKSIYFLFTQKSFKIFFSKWIHIEPFSDGLGFKKDGAPVHPICLKGMVDSWFAYNFIINISR